MTGPDHGAEESTSVTLFTLWLAGLAMGASTLLREPLLGLKRLVLPASYWRSVEFRYVWQRVPTDGHRRILDLGSPKDLASFLARRTNSEVVATDILDSAVAISERYCQAQGISGRGPGRVWSETQDGRSLAYPDDSFDAAFSVSVLEHIPERGDTDAIRELVRVVRPGGVVAVTVPYDVTYRETFVRGDVYERTATGEESLFFERHYDRQSLADRLLSIPQTRVIDLQLWGERFAFESFLNRIGPIRTLLSPLETLCAAVFLERVSDTSPCPKAAFFTLEKLDVA